MSAIPAGVDRSPLMKPASDAAGVAQVDADDVGAEVCAELRRAGADARGNAGDDDGLAEQHSQLRLAS